MIDWLALKILPAAMQVFPCHEVYPEVWWIVRAMVQRFEEAFDELYMAGQRINDGLALAFGGLQPYITTGLEDKANG